MAVKIMLKILKILFTIYLVLFLLIIDPLHDFKVNPLDRYDNYDYYLLGIYEEFPGGENAYSFLPKPEKLPTDCTVTFLYEDPRTRAENLWCLRQILIDEPMSHKYYLSLYFDNEQAYRRYKDAVFQEYGFAESQKITKLSSGVEDKLLYAVFDGDHYGGLYFDDEADIIKYIFVYQFGYSYYSGILGLVTHYSSGLYDDRSVTNNGSINDMPVPENLYRLTFYAALGFGIITSTLILLTDRKRKYNIGLLLCLSIYTACQFVSNFQMVVYMKVAAQFIETAALGGAFVMISTVAIRKLINLFRNESV